MTGTPDSRHVRVVALGVVRRNGDNPGSEELLVSRHRDPDGEPFYRPLGGGVEFGEPSEEALRREFQEELGVTLLNVSQLATYEDVFTADGRTHHELWRLYETDIADDWPYDEDEFSGYESDGEEIECVWKSVADLGPEDGADETFYPEALLADL